MLSLVPAEKISGNTGPLTQNPQPTLSIYPTDIIGDLRYAQLVLFHEYVHYRQWKTGKIPAEAFLLVSNKDADHFQRACKQKWHAEL